MANPPSNCYGDLTQYSLWSAAMNGALKAVGQALSLTLAASFASISIVSAEPAAELVAAAKAEGKLTVIALPRDWCGYGGIIDRFEAKYGLDVNETRPDAGSAQEIDAIKAGGI